jgi:uncharacterized protein YjbI with pentapeptide repeats
MKECVKTDVTLKPTGIKQRIEARDADLPGSTFHDVRLSGSISGDVNVSGVSCEKVNMSGWRINNVNLAGLRISKANLASASIVDSWTDSMMTIEGIPVANLMAAYRAAKSGS